MQVPTFLYQEMTFFLTDMDLTFMLMSFEGNYGIVSFLNLILPPLAQKLPPSHRKVRYLTSPSKDGVNPSST